MQEARIKQFCFCLFCLLIHCIFRYSYNKIFWWPWNFCKNYQKCWHWMATFF